MFYTYPGVGSLALVRWYLVILLLLGTSISTRLCILGRRDSCRPVACFVGLLVRHKPRPAKRKTLVLQGLVFLASQVPWCRLRMIRLSQLSGPSCFPL